MAKRELRVTTTGKPPLSGAEAFARILLEQQRRSDLRVAEPPHAVVKEARTHGKRDRS